MSRHTQGYKRVLVRLVLSVISMALTTKIAAQVAPQPGAAITAEQARAHEVLQRLLGVRISIDDPRVGTVVQQLQSGVNWVDAVKVATDPASATSDSFYNITARYFAAKMSTREETIQAPLSDFSATVIGYIKDSRDARGLLYDNLYYRADQAVLATAPTNPAQPAGAQQTFLQAFLTSNSHYAEIDRRLSLPVGQATRIASLRTALVPAQGQRLANNGVDVPNPDPAGIITSRGFLEAHAVAGTNRRLVEFLFKEFACYELGDVADNTRSDAFVGRDVDRFPSGSNAEYQAKCKSCHTIQDSMRPAFAYVDFENGIVRHSQVLPAGGRVNNANANLNAGQIKADPTTGVVIKMNRNEATFPNGYVIRDNAWINQATAGANQSKLGWRSETTGVGIGAMGRMFAQSQAYSRCMVQRVYRQVCARSPASYESSFVSSTANTFETRNYDLNWLFRAVATSDNCLGKM